MEKMKKGIFWEEGTSQEKWTCSVCGRVVYSQAAADAHVKSACSKPAPFINWEAEETEWGEENEKNENEGI